MSLVKTLARMEWYLKEVVPIFVLGTALLFALDLLGAAGVDPAGAIAAGGRLAGPAGGGDRCAPDRLPAPRLRRRRPLRHGTSTAC